MNQHAFIEIIKEIDHLTQDPLYNPQSPPILQKDLEDQIDTLVYQLYNLTPEEIAIIEEV